MEPPQSLYSTSSATSTDPSNAFGFLAAELVRVSLSAHEGDSDALLRKLLREWRELPLEANKLLGTRTTEAMDSGDVRLFAMYLQSVLLNVKLFPTFRERPVFFAKLIEDRGPWVVPLVAKMSSTDDAELSNLIYQTFCVVLEAFPPQPRPVTLEFMTVIAVTCAKTLCEPGPNPPGRNVLALLEAVLLQNPPCVHATIAAMPAFWPMLWEHFGGSDSGLGAILGLVQRVVLSCEALTAELLRMVLVDHRVLVLGAMGSSYGPTAVSALSLLQTLAMCRHEVISDALIAAGFVEFMARRLVVDRPNASVVHQYVFSVLRLVAECAADESAGLLLGGELVGWLRTSLAAVPQSCSARANLETFAVFLGAQEVGSESRAKCERFTASMPGWDEFVGPLISAAEECKADPSLLAEMAAKKRPQTQAQGPVQCCVCDASLTAYYLIEEKVYCSEHRPAQCATCRAPLTGEMVQVGFLKYCLPHAPPKCVRCQKFISRYLTVPEEGIVCVDCGAPKCATCKQPILQGQCITFRENRYHGECFKCSMCGDKLGEQFLLSGADLVCLPCGQSKMVVPDADVDSAKNNDADDDNTGVDGESDPKDAESKKDNED